MPLIKRIILAMVPTYLPTRKIFGGETTRVEIVFWEKRLGLKIEAKRLWLKIEAKRLGGGNVLGAKRLATTRNVV